MRLLRYFGPLLALAACTSDEPTDTTDKNTIEPPPPVVETADTAGGGGAGTVTGQLGSIVLGHWPADAQYSSAYYGYGIFSDQDAGTQNLAYCFLLGFTCVDTYAAIGGSVTPDPGLLDFLPYAVWYNAGNSIEAAGIRMSLNQNYGFPFYLGNVTGLSGPGNLEFGGDLVNYAEDDVFPVAPAIVATSPDPLLMVEASAGETIDFAWTPGNDEVYLESEGQIWTLDDTLGTFTLSVDDLGLTPPLDSTIMVLSRVTNTTVDAAGNTVKVQTRSDQWYYLDFSDTVGWNELTLGTSISDDCAGASALQPLPAGQYFGDLSTHANSHDLGDGNPLTGYASIGNDGVVTVLLQAGQTLTATYRQTFADGSIYLLDPGCDVAAALAGADATFNAEPEDLTFTAKVAGPYYLVLDNYYLGDSYSLVIDIQ